LLQVASFSLAESKIEGKIVQSNKNKKAGYCLTGLRENASNFYLAKGSCGG
jgi:hypothetical protein